MSHFSKFFDIAKIDEAKQSVWGYASTPTLDSDGEIVDLAAIKGALPDYMEWGNIREMHKASAVGTAIEEDTHVDDKGLWLGAHIVDPAAWLKVKKKVYKGFSIGGSVTRKKGKNIEAMTLVEISLVDRPANPDCKIEIFKMSGETLEGNDADVVALVKGGEGWDIAKFIDEDAAVDEAGLFKRFARMVASFIKSDGASPVEPKLAVVISPYDDPDVAKTMRGIGELTYAFTNIRDAQRGFILEGKVEGDSNDLEIARRLGDLGKTLAGVIADAANHEGSEAVTLTDIDDLKYRPPWPHEGITINLTEYSDMTASADPTDLAKRKTTQAAHARQAAEHMEECAKCHKGILDCTKALHAMHLTHAAGIKEAAAMAKAAPDFPHGEALTHLQGIASHCAKLNDHHMLAKSHMSLANGTNIGDWGGTSVEGVTPPKGDTERNDGTHPVKGVMDPDMVKAITDAAYWRGQAEALGKLPAARAGAAPMTFDVTKLNTRNGAGEILNDGATQLAKLMTGVEVGDGQDPSTMARAAGKMIGNMIQNGFGKNPILDPSFRGGAGA